MVSPTIAGAGAVSHSIFRVARLHKLMASLLLREIGLYPNQELLMMRLWDEGPQRQVDLVNHLDTDAPTMARTVRRLERAGFVRITPSPSDRRVTVIEATRASLPLRQAVHRIWSELEAATVGSLSAESRADALHLLEQLERNLMDANRQRAVRQEALRHPVDTVNVGQPVE
jgi:MarR family transcriptional regulator, organic hydroperoxide resistance regulator